MIILPHQGYTHSTTTASPSSLRVTVVGRVPSQFFVIDELNIGQILRLTSFAQDDLLGGLSLDMC